jgi:hypothetical protein
MDMTYKLPCCKTNTQFSNMQWHATDSTQSIPVTSMVGLVEQAHQMDIRTLDDGNCEFNCSQFIEHQKCEARQGREDRAEQKVEEYMDSESVRSGIGGLFPGGRPCQVTVRA